MIIVSDTSPITNLIKIDKLDLLESLFQEVIIPQAVYEELAFYEGQRKIRIQGLKACKTPSPTS